MNEEQLIASATQIAKKFIRPQEGLCLQAYPDPKSALSKALSNMNKLALYKAGKFTLTKDLRELDASPWTIGYGCTGPDVVEGVLWTLEQAENDLDAQVKVRVVDVLKNAPKLAQHSPEKLAACVSLQYNIGSTAFRNSTVAKCIGSDDMIGAAQAFKLFNIAGGKVDQGLVNRRAQEAALFNSVRG